MGERLTLKQSTRGEEVTVHVGGHLTWENCPEFQEVISVLVEQRPSRIDLELSDLVMTDSSGLTKLVWFQRACNEKQIRATLQQPAEQVLRTLKLSKLDKVFRIESNSPAPTTSDKKIQVSEAQRRLALLVSNMLEAMLLFDERGHLILVNPAGLALTGYAADQSQTLGLAALAGEGSGEGWREVWEQVKAGGQIENRELLLRKFDGVEVWCSVSGTAARDERDKSIGMLFTLRNIDEQRKDRERLREEEAKAALGVLAAGFARDFECLLENEQRQIEELRSLLADQQRGPHLIAEMRQQHEYLRDFIHRLRALGQREAATPGTSKIQAAAESVLAELKPQMGLGVEVRACFAPGVAEAAMFETDLKQIMRQVCLNALEAMGESGELQIWSEMASVGAEGRRAPHQPAGSFVRLCIQDSGPGMPPDVRRRAFEPYFSTRPGRHRGLGLSLVYGLLRLHNGWIELESNPGQFTRVGLYLPTSQSGAPAAVPPQEPARAGRVLVIDDEGLVLNFAAAYLERYGYEVVKAQDATEALAIFGAPGEKLDIVITDLSLPGMNGQELIRAMREIQPEAKFLISSGLGASDLAEAAREPGVLGVLQKPYRGEQLLEAVRQALK